MIMNTPEFQKTLREKGIYTTSEKSVYSLLDRLLGRTDTWYYLKIFRVIASGAIIARCGRYDTPFWGQQSYEILQAAEVCGAKITISGCESVAKFNKPVVFVSNHMSMLETMLYPGILLSFGGLATVVKESLLTYPVFGHIMSAVDPISVSRKSPRDDLKEVLIKGEAILRAGRSILIFPQSTRRVEFNSGEFNSLGVKLAKKAGVPIVPIALKTDFHSIGIRFKDIGDLDRTKPVYFKFGPVMEITGNGRAEHEKTIEFIETNLRSWGAIVEKSNRPTGKDEQA
jgi:1-acyl-sn-glycerol-3-phosphate acyltransferase